MLVLCFLERVSLMSSPGFLTVPGAERHSSGGLFRVIVEDKGSRARDHFAGVSCLHSFGSLVITSFAGERLLGTHPATERLRSVI